MNRREFIRRAGLATAGVGTAGAMLPITGRPATRFGGSSPNVVIVAEPGDPVAGAAPAQWALQQLVHALRTRKLQVVSTSQATEIPAGARSIVAAGPNQPLAREILSRASVPPPSGPESLALVPGRIGKSSALFACGSDPPGLAYALLELADRVLFAKEPLSALQLNQPVQERPANQIRSIMRLFASNVEDKSWFYDREFWRRYLTMLVTQRFNRFNLALGLGYDFPTGIRDAYFHFAYPFLVTVPGHDVRVTGLASDEPERNLQMLRFISDETEARGLHFQLGLWTHAYKWTNSPQANHVIQGLTPESHAPYCRDALRTLLTACPAISGVTLRIHGESGVAEGSYEFWKTVFDGMTQCGRRLEIDMHAKGMDAGMIDLGLATGLPVNISPKFWAEHMGLPYHQAGIRPTEKPPPGRKDEGFFSRSSGSRSFLRYGYGDLLSQDRRYGVLHRMWPGTQRLLLWGDPLLAAGYGRAASFCGSRGLELFEPLSFKGRKGSGLPGGRDAYEDKALKPPQDDFEKYAYGYRLWGRLLYNPDSSPETWRRQFKADYGRAAEQAETALANASRILPIITTAHTPSAANNNYWPEMYSNMPIVDANRKHPYGDTPSPKRFGTVSPLDPQLFSRVEEFVGELLKGKVSGKYSPSEVAGWLLARADTANAAMEKATKLIGNPADPAFRRLAVDVVVQIGLGRFFAEKFRSGVLFALHERTGDKRPLREALAAYRRARVAWAELAKGATGVYAPDVTFGLEPQLRGHWNDRLQAIDEDIADMQKQLELASASVDANATTDLTIVDRAVRAVFSKSKPPMPAVMHTLPKSFQRGRPLIIRLTTSPGQESSINVRLLYRQVNQAEEFRSLDMLRDGRGFNAIIPPEYTKTPFPLQYYFEVRDRNGAWIYPGLGADLNQQPYYVTSANVSN